MYKLNKSSNSLEGLEQKSLSSLKFREREHLQEWIAKSPEVFGEDLLIIQKEFSGFDNTRERLDLLALDASGALVIIENKLDSGHDVTWQALKYASYCSSLSKQNITRIYQDYLDGIEPGARAEERISDFMDQEFEDIELNQGVSQRIFLVATEFRKEVTSTVLWLMNFNVRIKCFRVASYIRNEEVFLIIEQIIPTQEAEEYMIGMAEKAQENIDSPGKLENRRIRHEFWTQLLQAMNETSSDLFRNISPKKGVWVVAGSGVRGVKFYFGARKSYARAELYIDSAGQKANKLLFDQLYSQKDAIEETFGGELTWERLDKRRACRIKAEIPGNILAPDEWPAMIEFMVDAMCRLEKAVKEPCRRANEQLKKIPEHGPG